MVKKREIEPIRRALEAHVQSDILRLVSVDTDQRKPFIVDGKHGYIPADRLSVDEAHWFAIGIRVAQLRYERNDRIADLVFALLDGNEWDADTLQEIGLVFTNLGRPLSGPAHDVMHGPCDRCGKPIPSNFDRSAHYCDECAAWVEAHDGDEIDDDLSAPAVLDYDGPLHRHLGGGWHEHESDELGHVHDDEPRRAPLTERSRCGIHGDSTASGRCASCDADADAVELPPDPTGVDLRRAVRGRRVMSAAIVSKNVRPTRMYGHEIVGGDLVHVPVHGEHVVMSVEHDEHDSRLLLDDGSTLLSRHGAFVIVVAPVQREYRRRERGRRRVSHVHFPNGTVADTADKRLLPTLVLAALEIAGIDRRFLRVQTVQHRRELSLATHYVDPLKTDVTLCGIDRAETSDDVYPYAPGVCHTIASCVVCQSEAWDRVIGP